jgi:hypothetical protein
MLVRCESLHLFIPMSECTSSCCAEGFADLASFFCPKLSRLATLLSSFSVLPAPYKHLRSVSFLELEPGRRPGDGELAHVQLKGNPSPDIPVS